MSENINKIVEIKGAGGPALSVDWLMVTAAVLTLLVLFCWLLYTYVIKPSMWTRIKQLISG